MPTITTSEILVVDDPVEQTQTIAVAGFLAGYCGSTRTSYATHLRLFATWCDERDLALFSVRRAHLELFGRGWRRTGGCAPRWPGGCPLASFYRYCEQEQFVERNPALNIRRPKVDYESRTLGLDRNELGAFLVQAGLGSPRDHALASLLALNGAQWCARQENVPRVGPAEQLPAPGHARRSPDEGPCSDAALIDHGNVG